MFFIKFYSVLCSFIFLRKIIYFLIVLVVTGLSVYLKKKYIYIELQWKDYEEGYDRSYLFFKCFDESYHVYELNKNAMRCHKDVLQR